MAKRKSPWMRAPLNLLPMLDPIAKALCPAIRFKPGDLWEFLEVKYRVAILRQPYRGRYIGLVRIAFHFVWRIPAKEEIRRRHPNWTESVVEGIHGKFRLHELKWGPGDVELVTMILKRYPRGPRLDLLDPEEFVPIEVTVRNGAHFKGVFKQIIKNLWTWWKKIGQNRVTINLVKDKAEYYKDRLLLTIDSYHHSFFTFEELRTNKKIRKKIKSWCEIVVPKVNYFDNKSWKYYKIVPKRGYEKWEVRKS